MGLSSNCAEALRVTCLFTAEGCDIDIVDGVLGAWSVCFPLWAAGGEWSLGKGPSMKDEQGQVEGKVQSKLKQYKCSVYKMLGQHM